MATPHHEDLMPMATREHRLYCFSARDKRSEHHWKHFLCCICYDFHFIALTVKETVTVRVNSQIATFLT